MTRSKTLAFVLAVLTSGSPEPSLAQMAAPPDIENGRGIVVGTFSADPSGACFQCHGMEGAGDAAAVFPRLTDQTYKYLYDSLRDYASGVRENAVMSPIARALTDQQMRDVAAYYASQVEAPYPPQESVDPTLLQLGAGLAAVGSAEKGIQGCVNCHGPEGVGLPPTYPFLAGQHRPYIEAQLRAWKTGERGADGFGIMADIARRMSDEEISAVAAYYASLRPAIVTPDVDETEFPMVELAGETARDEAR